MSDTYRRDTLWIPYGYRGHMGSGINLIISEVKVMLGAATCRTFGGLDGTDPLPAQKKQRPRTLGITTDVTPPKIVGLNNFRWLQGAQVAQAGGRGKRFLRKLRKKSKVVQAGGEGK